MEADEVDAKDGSTTVEAKTPLHFVKAYYFASFCFFATNYRYLTLYFEEDGLGASEIGMLWSVYRIIGTLTTPFVAAFADKTKRARTIVQCATAASALPFFALAIPLSDNTLKVVPRALALWLFSFVGSPQGALRDALAIAACAQDVEAWGKARVYGAIGWGMMHMILGPLLDVAGFIVLFVAFVVFGVLLMLVTSVSVPQSCGKVKKEVSFGAVLDIFRRNYLFFINMGAIGGGFSMVEGMLFLLLQELEASKLLCGLAVVVTVVFELPIFHFAKPIMGKLGTRRMILLGQFAWVIRAIFYANMTEAWTVLLIEPLHGVTFALVWTAATQHVANPAVSGEGLEASAQGLLNVCFMGIGPVIGLSVGGWLFEHLGSHAVYGVFSVVVLAIGLVYALWGGRDATTYGNVESVDDGANATTIGNPAESTFEGDTIVDKVDLDGLEECELSLY